MQFTGDLQEMYQLLIEILQACLDESKVQLKMYFRSCNPEEYADHLSTQA